MLWGAPLTTLNTRRPRVGNDDGRLESVLSRGCVGPKLHDVGRLRRRRGRGRRIRTRRSTIAAPGGGSGRLCAWRRASVDLRRRAGFPFDRTTPAGRADRGTSGHQGISGTRSAYPDRADRDQKPWSAPPAASSQSSEPRRAPPRTMPRAAALPSTVPPAAARPPTSPACSTRIPAGSAQAPERAVRLNGATRRSGSTARR